MAALQSGRRSPSKLPAHVLHASTAAFYRCRVYPGHGIRFVTRTGQLVVLSSHKVKCLYQQKKKPAKLYWTLASRRVHKKKQSEETAIKRRARRVVKIQRGYVGAEKIEEIKKKNAAARPAADAAAVKTKSGSLVQAAVAEAKARQKAAQAARKKAGGAGAAAGAKAATKHSGRGR